MVYASCNVDQTLNQSSDLILWTTISHTVEVQPQQTSKVFTSLTKKWKSDGPLGTELNSSVTTNCRDIYNTHTYNSQSSRPCVIDRYGLLSHVDGVRSRWPPADDNWLIPCVSVQGREKPSPAAIYLARHLSEGDKRDAVRWREMSRLSSVTRFDWHLNNGVGLGINDEKNGIAYYQTVFFLFQKSEITNHH